MGLKEKTTDKMIATKQQPIQLKFTFMHCQFKSNLNQILHNTALYTSLERYWNISSNMCMQYLFLYFLELGAANSAPCKRKL